MEECRFNIVCHCLIVSIVVSSSAWMEASDNYDLFRNISKCYSTRRPQTIFLIKLTKAKKKNKALFPAHRVTKINLMRAAAKILFFENVKGKI